jgi:hypothetical protein
LTPTARLAPPKAHAFIDALRLFRRQESEKTDRVRKDKDLGMRPSVNAQQYFTAGRYAISRRLAGLACPTAPARAVPPTQGTNFTYDRGWSIGYVVALCMTAVVGRPLDWMFRRNAGSDL